MLFDAPLPRELIDKVEREQLRLAVEQHRRVVIPHFLGSLVVALLAWKTGVHLGFLACWLTVTGALQLTRYLFVSRLKPRLQVATEVDVAQALSYLAWWIRSLGFVNAIVIFLVFARPMTQEHLLLTMVLLGNATGTVSIVSGRTRLYVQWALVYGGALALVWALQGTWETLGVAALLCLLFTMLAMHVRDQGRMLVELVSLSDSLRIERDRVERASASKTRFFAAASHDLRQPLTALSYQAATIQALAQRDGDSLLKQIGDGVSRALSESQSLLDSLLEVSKLDAGAVAVHWESADVLALVTRVCEEAGPVAQARGLELTFQPVADSRNLTSRTDAALLRRILQNLISNAIKFTDQGRVVVSISTRDSGGVEKLFISVRDTGVGIPSSDKERIFEEFFQLGNSERDRTRGLGLGLSIVKRMVRLIDGRIFVESTLGSGSVFTVELPLALQPVASAPSGSPLELPLLSKRHEGRYRALCLDDEPEVRSSLQLLLTTVDWDVRVARDLSEARESLKEGFQPDVLLVDFRLRMGESGLDAIDALRSDQCTAPALLITGDTEPDRILQAQAADIGVLYKPVDGQQLIAKITALVAQAQATVPLRR